MDRKTSHNSKKQRISPLLLSGLYPPPGTLPNPNLFQRGLGSGAGADRPGGDVAHHGIRDRAEGAHARTIRSHRGCIRIIAAGRARSTEVIAALSARRQLAVDPA